MAKEDHGTFIGSLVVQIPLHDCGHRQLHHPLTYISEEPPMRIVVPTGFTTDYASVPRIFHNILPPIGKWTYPAVVHDYLYATGMVERNVADRVFLGAMRSTGVGLFRAWIMYSAVRVFGFVPWANHRAADRPS